MNRNYKNTQTTKNRRCIFLNNSTYKGKNRIKHSISEIEDTTKYGEFVSSYFAWLTLDRQKVKAKQMEEMTKKKKL